jgi:hypothetical protein
MDSGEYQEEYKSLRRDEVHNKRVLVGFENQYPGVVNSKNVEKIISDFKKKEKDQGQMLSWLKDQMIDKEDENEEEMER